MIIEPMGSRVLIRPIEQETMTKSGLILPDSAKEKPQRGKIEAVGDEEEMIVDLSVGDVVIYAKYSGSEITIDDVKYLILDAGDILARLRE